MAKRKKRDFSGSVGNALSAATGGSSGTSSPSADERQASPPRQRSKKGHKKTSTGYVQANGNKKVRTSLFITEEQRMELKILAARSGFGENVSEFVMHELGLNELAE